MKKNYRNKENTGLLIRIDDVTDHMNWELMDKCEELFDKFEIKPLLGVIPNNQDLEFKNFPKRENFWGIVRNCKRKDGKFQCMVSIIFMKLKRIKTIILNTVVNQSFMGDLLKSKITKLNV